MYHTKTSKLCKCTCMCVVCVYNANQWFSSIDMIGVIHYSCPQLTLFCVSLLLTGSVQLTATYMLDTNLT